MSILFMSFFLAQDFHDIAPPIDYSLISPWVIFLGACAALTIAGLIVWFIIRSRKRAVPMKSARERVLELLEGMQSDVEKMQPYRFSIRVSDALRCYVTEQFNLPVTRQTSVEFLNGLTKASPFSEEEKSLLEDFLSRCDLIKFARYEGTAADSTLLLEEAIRFVKGGQLELATV